MKVLWFEVTEPEGFQSSKKPIGGWQDSLERVIKTISDIELVVAFVTDKKSEVKKVNGVTYVPMYVYLSKIDWHFRNYWDFFVEKTLPVAREIVDKFRPDIIQVFGIEWPFGQIAAYTKIPVVVHIMGAIIPYNNAGYPPGYSFKEELLNNIWHPINLYHIVRDKRNRNKRECWERKTWNLITNYMGRTVWDKSLSQIMNPKSNYYHVEEAMRLEFYNGGKRWKYPEGNKIKITSTGCGTFWKGPDMVLKVSRILKELKIDFEWNLVGYMDSYLKKYVEKHEGITFEECSVHILGYKKPDQLVDILCQSTMYIHTAYIENSPNSICEAQCLGVPIISTNVGGVSTLLRNGLDGILVPANDPWQMAFSIIQLYSNKEEMTKFSLNSRNNALQRHNDEQIKNQLLTAYNSILKNGENTSPLYENN